MIIENCEKNVNQHNNVNTAESKNKNQHNRMKQQNSRIQSTQQHQHNDVNTIEPNNRKQHININLNPTTSTSTWTQQHHSKIELIFPVIHCVLYPDSRPRSSAQPMSYSSILSTIIWNFGVKSQHQHGLVLYCICLQLEIVKCAIQSNEVQTAEPGQLRAPIWRSWIWRTVAWSTIGPLSYALSVW